MASEQRIRDEDRIRRATRALVVGSLGATAAFAGLAAAATHHESAASTGQAEQTDQSSSSSDSGGFSAPQQSFAPPVAQSGGS
jgi:hypothetical protein